MDQKPDILWCRNNETISVTPAPGGRLDALVHRFLFADDPPQVWIFRDCWVSDRTVGDKVREFFSLRGVLSGSFADGEAFLRMCRDLGFVVKYDAELRVPCSSGFKLGVKLQNPEDERTGGEWYEFTRAEYMALRWDRPLTKLALQRINLGVAVDVAHANEPV